MVPGIAYRPCGTSEDLLRPVGLDVLIASGMSRQWVLTLKSRHVADATVEDDLNEQWPLLVWLSVCMVIVNGDVRKMSASLAYCEVGQR